MSRREVLEGELRDVRDSRSKARDAHQKANSQFWELAKLFAPELAKEIREKYRDHPGWGMSWTDFDRYARPALIKAAREKQWKNMTNTQKLEMLFRENHG